MKAVVFHQHGGPDRLVYQDLPDPTPGPGEVLVRVRACSINHLDLWVRQGIPAYPVTLPHISGTDVAGIVAQAGPGVENLTPGRRVLIAPGLSCFRCDPCRAGHDNLCDTYRIFGAQVDGGYAEYTKAPAGNLIPIPDRLTFEQAAAFPLVFLTAWHMLITRAKLQPKETVLVLAAGSGVGSAAVQIARHAGAQVFAAAGSDEKLDKAKALGAEAGINYTREDLAQRTRTLTDGRGADVVVEHVGPETFRQSVAALAKTGRLVTCGVTTGSEAVLDLRFVYSRQLTILGSITGTRSELVTLTGLMGDGRLTPVIDSVHPLKEARAAQERLINRQVFGKLILVP